jgi:hypothetical protein
MCEQARGAPSSRKAPLCVPDGLPREARCYCQLAARTVCMSCGRIDRLISRETGLLREPSHRLNQLIDLRAEPRLPIACLNRLRPIDRVTIVFRSRLELHHRNLALLLSNRRLHDTLGRQHAPDDDAIEPQYWECHTRKKGGGADLAGCGKTIAVRWKFNGPHV